VAYGLQRAGGNEAGCGVMAAASWRHSVVSGERLTLCLALTAPVTMARNINDGWRMTHQSAYDASNHIGINGGVSSQRQW